MDIIFIKELRLDVVIGINDWERQVKQPVFFDIEMATDTKVAAASESIKDTINYKAVTKSIVELVAERKFELVETLAESVASLIMDEFNVPWVRLRASKRGAVRGARDVGVLIERGTSS